MVAPWSVCEALDIAVITGSSPEQGNTGMWCRLAHPYGVTVMLVVLPAAAVAAFLLAVVVS